MKLVVGLGNPGKRYEGTRHNIGFRVVDAIAHMHGARWKRDWRASARTCSVNTGRGALILVKPQTFMNRSGHAVAAMLRKKGLEPTDIVMVFDDVDIDCGRVRVRGKGGAGSHNGVQSVLQTAGTQEVARVRVGVGPRPKGEDLVDYVLSDFTREEHDVISDAVKRAAEAVTQIEENGLDAAMNEFNQQ